MRFTVSEKSTCPRCKDALNTIISGKFYSLQKNQCLHYHNTIVHGSSLIPQSSPIYAYLQKAALTLRLILEALPIPSRRHRLRVWVTYLSIKVLLRRSPGWVSVFFSSKFWPLWFWTYFQDHNPRSCHLKFRCQLLNIATFSKCILSIMKTFEHLS